MNSLIFAPKYDAGAGAHKLPKDRLPIPKSRGSTQPSGRRQSSKEDAENQAQRQRQSVAKEVSFGQTLTGPIVPASRCGGAEEDWTEPKFTVREKTLRKDYRSFAANMFGTVAFKMLEWLTPAAVEDMTETATRLQGGTFLAKRRTPASIISSGVSTPEELSVSAPTESTVEGDDAADDKEDADVGDFGPDQAEHHKQDQHEDHVDHDTGDAVDRHAQPGDSKSTDEKDDGKPSAADPSEPHNTASALSALPVGHAAAASGAVRNASARVRKPAPIKRPQHILPMEPFVSDTDDLLPALRSPLLSAVSTDGVGHKTHVAKPLKSSTSTIARPISQLSNAGYFDGVSLEKMPPLKTSAADLASKASRSQFDLSMRSGGSDSSVPQSATPSSRSLSLDRSSSDRSSLPQDMADADIDAGVDADLDADLAGLLPQTLTRLDAEVIDFICDVLQDDYDREYHFLEPPVVSKFHTPYDGQPRPLERKQQQPTPHRSSIFASKYAAEWRMFIDQSLFYVMSDPHALLQSFTRDGQLYDTQTLWYCMLRLTRVAPSLVLHSLWTAAEALFTPSKALLAQRLPSARIPPSILTDAEAGRLMAICLHALVGVAPVVDDVRKLYDMSRMRSQGTSLSGSASMSRQSTALCLQYDDAFSYDQAIRLARRLFSAVSARRFYAGMARDSGSSKADATDVLAPLFDQLDFLNMDAAYIFNFTVPDRTIHETRVPTLLLDWARTVMLQDWSGSPVVPADGPFGGALTLIAAIRTFLFLFSFSIALHIGRFTNFIRRKETGPPGGGYPIPAGILCRTPRGPGDAHCVAVVHIHAEDVPSSGLSVPLQPGVSHIVFPGDQLLAHEQVV